LNAELPSSPIAIVGAIALLLSFVLAAFTAGAGIIATREKIRG
jgi:hypothetical protein